MDWGSFALGFVTSTLFNALGVFFLIKIFKARMRNNITDAIKGLVPQGMVQ